MRNNNKSLSWKLAFKSGFEKKYIQLVIDSYKEIINKGIVINKVWEDTRRNILCSQMQRMKGKYGITFNIAPERGVWDEDFKDKGKIDICCFLNELDDQYIAFECKRFLKKDIVPSYISREYYGEGIKRFEDNIYSQNVDFGGLIAFLEEGDYHKLGGLMVVELPKYSIDRNIEDSSKYYNHDYVYETIHLRKDNKDIKLTHILLDFS